MPEQRGTYKFRSTSEGEAKVRFFVCEFTTEDEYADPLDHNNLVPVTRWRRISVLSDQQFQGLPTDELIRERRVNALMRQHYPDLEPVDEQSQT